MKKSILLVVIMTIISVNTFSQKISLCEAFGQLIQQSDSGFSSIKGEKKESASLVTIYNSKVQISDAIKTEIISSTFKTDFVVNFGSFSTESEAKAQVEKQKKDFIACFPMVRFSDYSENMFKTLQTNIIEQADRGFRYYKANFKIEKWKEAYSVTFNYPTSSKIDLFGEKEQNITEFFTVPKQLDNQQYSQDIRRIIAEGKTGFASIIGEKLEVTINGFECYETKFQVSGTSNCYIEDRTMNIKNYVIPVVKNGEGVLLQKTADEFLGKLMSALGPDYALQLHENQLVFDFVHKNQPQQKIATFLIEIEDTKFDITILISAYTQK